MCVLRSSTRLIKAVDYLASTCTSSTSKSTRRIEKLIVVVAGKYTAGVGKIKAKANKWYQSQVEMSSDDEETNKEKTAAAAKQTLVTSEGSGKPLMMISRTSYVPIQYPMVTDTNYVVWATKMKFIL